MLQDWDAAFGLNSTLLREAESLGLPLPVAGVTPGAVAQALRTLASRVRELEEQVRMKNLTTSNADLSYTLMMVNLC